MPDHGSANKKKHFPTTAELKQFGCFSLQPKTRQVSDMKTNQLNYSFPPISVLDRHDVMVQSVLPAEIERVQDRILKTLAAYDVRVESSTLSIGPSVSLLKVKLEPGQVLRLGGLGVKGSW